MNNMINNLRRAGVKLKTMRKMHQWARIQFVEKQPPVKDAGNRCYLLELPTELLLEIISHLSALPEACLALTCKSLFMISGPILNSKSLHFSRDFAPLFHHYRNGHNFVTPRWQFINLLENSRWQACSRCLKLHPRNSFTSRELKRASDSRSCNLGELAGIVDLCPCKKLTYRDKMDLVELLLIRKKTISALTAQFGSNTVKDRFCWHSCTESYGTTNLKIELYPELDDDNKLIIRTDYQLTIEAGQLGKEEHMTPRFGCAHRSVDLWLASVCQTTICRIYDTVCHSCKRISICNTCNSVLKCPRKQPTHPKNEDRGTYHFWTERSLGGPSPIPDGEWAAQRIHPAEPSVNVDNCSELCPWTVREHPPPTNPPSIAMDIIDNGVNDQSLNQLYSSIHMI